jgi:hypothetical protein
MDKKLDERVAAARARVHDAAQHLDNSHSAFISASESYEKALAAYREANYALCADDKKAIDRVADANELAKASDSERRLKAQKEL